MDSADQRPLIPPRSGLRTRRRRARRYLVCTLAAALAVASGGWPAEPETDRGADLTELTIEELLSLKVTSVAKKEQQLVESAAAVYVITADDIRRSGATTIPDLLRRVPGLQVARIDGTTWAVTARGFNGRFANKLLVLVDGRSVYTPLFAGVYWDVQDTLLEDVERIEVIRGPGASLWGANAVNGVINILTRSASETQGGLLVAGAGDQERRSGVLRYGGRVGSTATFRVYGKYFDRDPLVDAAGNPAADWSEALRGGFRLDWQPQEGGSLTVQGELYDGDGGISTQFVSLEPPYLQTVDHRLAVAGGHLLARWDHSLSERSELTLQAYYDGAERQTGTLLGEANDTYDLDFQHRLRSADRHELIWGLGFRRSRDRIDGSFQVTLDPARRTDDLWSAFVQDEIRLLGERLRLTLGSKFEHNDYTGFEIQPTVRAWWRPRPRHALWAAVSRAVRTPSRANDGLRTNVGVIPGATLTVLALAGNRDLESEDLLAYEIGYRFRPSKWIYLDLAGFHNVFRNLLGVMAEEPFFEPWPPPPHLVIPLRFTNEGRGEATGLEIVAVIAPAAGWKVRGAYTYLDLELEPSSPESLILSPESRDPEHQFNLGASVDVSSRLELDAALYYVDDLGAEAASYLRFDLRLAWRPRESLEVSLVLQDLLDDHHQELGTLSDVVATESERNVYGKLTWYF